MEQFDQLLTCAICLDRYRNPKLLPCQHSFCMEPCMEGLVNYVTRQVKCPECRAEHRIPYQGIQQLPTNVTLQRFLELHIEITGELPDPTSGQVMERCGVCSEKSYCTPCSHCEKRVCSDCKEAHLDILRREIFRINNQVRRTLHRLQDALSVIEKNSIHLQQNCSNVLEEIDDIYRRLSKALKERTDYLKSEIEVFLAKEQRNLTSLKENLEHEISNFDSNSEFAEKHMAEGSIWDDNELMDAKDIFLKTMEFIRNFECEPGEYHRRVRFAMSQDPNQLAATLAGLGELTINASPQIGIAPTLPTPSLGPGLMRSKSDHRVAAQFRQAEERYMAYGSDNNDGRTSPVGNRRYFGDRLTSRDRYGSTTENTRRNEYDYDSPLDLPSSESSRRSRFRSRFMRHLDSGDSDNEPSNRSVRFHEQSADNANTTTAPKKERERVLDTEDATRGPLSGITRLQDSPRVIKRIQEMESKDKKKDQPISPPTSLPGLNTTSQTVPTRRPTTAARQVSEEDEISKLKKQNKSQENSATATADSTTPTQPTRKTSAQSESHPGTPTSTERPKLNAAVPEKTSLSRQTSASSEKKETPASASETEDASKTNQRKRSGYLRQQSDSNRAENSRSAVSNSSQIPEETTSRSSQNSKSSFSRTSSSSSVNQDDSERTANGKTSRIGRLSADHFKNRSTSSESSTSAESSTHSSPVRNTGAAFTTEELKNRFTRRNSNSSSTSQTNESAVAVTTTTPSTTTTTTTTTTATPIRSRFGTVNQTNPSSLSSRFGTTGTTSSTTNSTSNTSSSSSNAPHRFQSRFLGRAGTPTAEVSRESENSSSSSDDSSESESDSDHVTKSTKEKELARTDIGPLLARSAHARDTSTSYNRNDPTSYSTKTDSSPLYGRNRSSVPSITSPPSSTRPTPSSSRFGSDSATTSSRYGTSTSDYSTPSSSALARSRTGSALHSDDLENKYPLTSKYLNRSRANMPETSTTSTTSETSSYTPRYGGYRSRFLNKSKSSAALAPDRDEGDDPADDEQNLEPENPSADQGWNHSTSSTLKSGEERYPSGRSRYAALKDRRSRLARSKSSHEVPVNDDNIGNGDQGEVEDTGTSSSADPESGSGSSLSSWARYLKKKYGPRNREPEATDPHSGKPNLSRARSLGSTTNGNRSWSPERDVKEDLIAPSSGLANLPRNHYMQKRKVLMKFGSRGSDGGSFTWPRGVAVGPDNSIVVADSSNHRVQVFDVNGRFLKEFGYYGNGEGEFDCLAGVAINRIGQYIIADRYNHRIQVFDPAGRFLRVFGSQGSADGKFSYPWGVTTDALGFIYVCDKENHRVQVFQSDGTFVGKFGSLGNRPGQLEHPHYIAVSCTNRVIVSDSNNHRIQVFDVNGKVLTTFGSEGADDGQFKFPRGVAVDDQGYIIVADSGNNRIQIFNPEGIFIRAFGCWGSGDGEFKGLEGIAVLSNGNIVVCDRENHRIQVF